MTERGIALRYNEASRSFIEFARTLSDAEWATPVPCTPLWTARDVLSHVSGIPDDGLAGRTDGAATEPWTASQVERNAGFTVEELLERWEDQYELFGAAIDSMGEERPPYDCHSHEHDVRHALGRPGNRDSAIIADAVPSMLANFVDVPVSIDVELDDDATIRTGRRDADTSVRLSTTRFEIFRSVLGRRTPGQVRSLDWIGDAAAVDTVVRAWFTFGPSSTRSRNRDRTAPQPWRNPADRESARLERSLDVGEQIDGLLQAHRHPDETGAHAGRRLLVGSEAGVRRRRRVAHSVSGPPSEVATRQSATRSRNRWACSRLPTSNDNTVPYCRS